MTALIVGLHISTPLVETNRIPYFFLSVTSENLDRFSIVFTIGLSGDYVKKIIIMKDLTTL